ncbi:hypothetical protein J6590_047074 [Homalodisca vitripennis]|nr:hypothetical protein J6590_047074 [Homalodisca vitripennis]
MPHAQKSTLFIAAINTNIARLFPNFSAATVDGTLTQPSVNYELGADIYPRVTVERGWESARAYKHVLCF